MPSLDPTSLPGLVGYWVAGDSDDANNLNVDNTNKSKPVITDAFDQSGNGRHLRNHRGVYQPCYRQGLTLEADKGGPWTTTRSFISADKWSSSQAYANALYLSDEDAFSLAGEFTFFDVLINSRTDGLRQLWSGNSGASVIEWVQGSNGSLYVQWPGISRTRVCNTLPRGPMTLELSRSSAGVISVVVNGTDATIAGLSAMPGLVRVDTMGWNRVNSGSHFDDYRMEAAITNVDTTAANRATVRAFWKARWSHYA